jgi:hypothetical protein
MLTYFSWAAIIPYPSSTIAKRQPTLLLSKLDTLIDTISSDRSIAAATDVRATATPLRKGIMEAAQPQMTLMESESW